MQIIPPLSSVSVRAIRESPLQKGDPFAPRQSRGCKESKSLSAPAGSLTFPLLGKRNLPSVDYFRGTTTRRESACLFNWSSLVVVDEVPLAKNGFAVFDVGGIWLFMVNNRAPTWDEVPIQKNSTHKREC